MIRDEELCRQVQNGSEAAMEALVHRYHQPIFAYLYRLSGHLQTAEDLTQETFVRMLARINTYQFPHAFRAWLYTIAHNLYRDYCKQAERRSLPTADPIERENPGTVDLLEHLAMQAEVTAALQALDPPHRNVVLLRFYNDMKIDDIASVTGLPSGTVKSRLFQAMRKLRALLLPDEAPQRREKA